MATFFPTSTEARAVVTWVRKHPLVSALAAAAAVASVVQFVRKERSRRPKRPRARHNEATTEAGSAHDADDGAMESSMHRSVSWCDEGAAGQPLTHVIEQLGPGRPMGDEVGSGSTRRTDGRREDTPQSQDQWGWYVAMTPPEDQFADRTPSTAEGRTPQAIGPGNPTRVRAADASTLAGKATSLGRTSSPAGVSEPQQQFAVQ